MAYPVLTANSPSFGYIAWTAFSIRYAGATYSVSAGNTNKKFVWWRYNNGTPVLEAGDVLPDGLGVSGNVIPNYSYEATTDGVVPLSWTMQQGYGSTTLAGTAELDWTTAAIGNASLKLTPLSTTSTDSGTAMVTDPITVVAGETWNIAAHVKGDTSDVAGFYVRVDRSDTGAEIQCGIENVTAYYQYWKRYKGSFTVPTGVTGVRPWVLAWGPTRNTQGLYVDNVVMTKDTIFDPISVPPDLMLFGNKFGTPINLTTTSVVQGGLIVTGSILTDALAANSVTSEKIMANAINANHISAGSVGANQIAANAIEANHISANAVSAGKISAGDLSAVVGVLGSLNIGTRITINSTDGIKVTRTDNTWTQLPVDGSAPTFTGTAQLDSATVTGSTGFTIAPNSKGTISAPVQLTGPTGSIPDPAAPPNISTSYATTSIGEGWERYGVAYANLGGTDYVYTAAWFGGYGTGTVNNRLYRWDSNGANELTVDSGIGYAAVGGCVIIGDYQYILMSKCTGSALNRNYWRVYQYSLNPWSYVSSWKVVNNGIAIWSWGDAAIGKNDSNEIVIAFFQEADYPAHDVSVWRYSTSGTYLGRHTPSGVLNIDPWPSEHINAVWVTTTGFGGQEQVILGTGGTLECRRTSDGGRSYLEWPIGHSSLKGICLYGTWHTLQSPWGYQGGDWVYHYTWLNSTTDFAYTWYDASNEASGLAETKRSPIRSIAPAKYARWAITAPSAPPNGGGPDDPDSIRLYAGSQGGTLYYQDIVTETDINNNILGKTFTSLASTGTSPPTTSGFINRVADTPLGSITDAVGTAIITGTSEWTAYTPTWTAWNSNPAIGNGVLNGAYKKMGRTILFRGRITAGSTTTFGSGYYRFGLPFAANSAYFESSSMDITGYALRSGVASSPALGRRSDSSSAFFLDATTTGSPFTPTSPWTFANGDTITWAGTYESAS